LVIILGLRAGELNMAVQKMSTGVSEAK